MSMMWLLIVYILIALGFSFLCSIAEAVILSVTSAHVALLEKDGHPAGSRLRKLKDDINEPLGGNRPFRIATRKRPDNTYRHNGQQGNS